MARLKQKQLISTANLRIRIVKLTDGLSRPYFRNMFIELLEANPANAKILCDFFDAEQVEFNIKNSTKEWQLKILYWLSRELHHKSFKSMTKQDIIIYLNTLRKSEEDDGKHRWIGTYNNRLMVFSKFFRWLYNPDEPNAKLRETPDCVNIRPLPRKEVSAYGPGDIWTDQEIACFLKYCQNKRDRAYVAMVALDTSARPHEILRRRIHQISYDSASDGTKYAYIDVSGKTTNRRLPLIWSLPYLKEWLQGGHPDGDNPNAFIFVSLADQVYGQRLTEDALGKHFREQYRDSFFPQLLKKDDKEVPPADKALIRSMLTKPWAPYIFRHTGLTNKSKILKEHVLRQYSGISLLEAYGIIKPKEKYENSIKLKPCPNCSEPNKPDAQYCLNPRCKFPLTNQAHSEIMERQKKEVETIVEQKLLELSKKVDFSKL